MTPANCAPNAGLSVGPRGLRASGPQMYGPGAHTDMPMQPGGQLGHPGQQGNYVATQMMPPHNQQPPQSISYAYQQPGMFSCLFCHLLVKLHPPRRFCTHLGGNFSSFTLTSADSFLTL
ncbi:unnamed protein product [Gongylonema pulchrum]|uniref:LITAF domain-containing protein n=1 Tax=Gongylonema pulchrum TaxID=637853 RepID=A0A183DH36_9BILA|nr:unnamed protein product [Gongylonema pulchrum]